MATTNYDIESLIETKRDTERKISRVSTAESGLRIGTVYYRKVSFIGGKKEQKLEGIVASEMLEYLSDKRHGLQFHLDSLNADIDEINRKTGRSKGRTN